MHRSFVHFLAVAARLQFHVVLRTWTQDKDSPFPFLNFDTVFKNSTYSRKICQHLTNWKSWINWDKFEEARIHFLTDVFVALVRRRYCLRWCYTGLFATMIFNATQRCNAEQCCNHSKQFRNNVATLCCASVKSSLRVVSTNITFKLPSYKMNQTTVTKPRKTQNGLSYIN